MLLIKSNQIFLFVSLRPWQSQANVEPSQPIVFVVCSALVKKKSAVTFCVRAQLFGSDAVGMRRFNSNVLLLLFHFYVSAFTSVVSKVHCRVLHQLPL